MNKNRRTLAVAMLLLAALILSGCCLSHEWQDATCVAPKTCAKCGETEGELLPHNWADATCTAPKTCKDCGTTEGEPVPHAWKDATCAAPKTCEDCGATEGEVLEHTWEAATCTAPETCGLCGETQGEALGHTEGETRQGKVDCINEISYQDTYCSVCNEIIATNKKTVKSLRDGGMFLMSPEEFTSRLNAQFRALYLSNYKAELGVGESGEALVLITAGSSVIGNVKFYDTHLQKDDGLLPYSKAGEQKSFNMVLLIMDKDTDATIRMVSAALMTVDPTLDMYADSKTFQKVGTAVLSKSRYKYNKILYMYSEKSKNVNQLGISLYDHE